MANEAAAKRYAQAAFDLAAEQGDFEAWTDALHRIAAFMTQGDAARALQDGRLREDIKQRLLDAGIGDLPRLPLNLARLLVKKGRVALAAEIAERFDRLLEEHRGIARAKAITAVHLSDRERDALAQRLRRSTGREVVLDAEVDPSILGGVVVQIGDKLIDGSTRTRLQALRGSLVGAVK